MQKTPISTLCLDDREFLIKRDDLFDEYLSGNKYRKLHKLLQTPADKLDTIISYGGTQSNAMLSIAAMCQQKGWKFIYYTKPLSQHQKQNQDGNYAQALRFGMQHKEIEHELYRDYVASLRVLQDERSFIIHQGGAVDEAVEGLEVLADEIRTQNPQCDAIATPSGTGTTAFFLAKHLSEFTIYTTPSVGDKSYLLEQMGALGKVPDNLIILESEKKYHFAKPYREFYEIYEKLLKSGIEFDLLYAPLLWKLLLEQTQERILYIHSGGVFGNTTMLERYKRKGFVR